MVNVMINKISNLFNYALRDFLYNLEISFDVSNVLLVSSHNRKSRKILSRYMFRTHTKLHVEMERLIE